MNADRWHGVRGLGSIGDSGQLTGQGSATLPTRSRACKCSLRSADRFRLRRGSGNDGRFRSAAAIGSGVDLELWVKSHGKWEAVDEDEVVLMPDEVIRCRFDLNHEVFPAAL